MGIAGLKSSRAAVLLEAIGKDLFPCLFQFLKDACILWLRATFYLPSQQWLVKSFTHGITLVLTFLLSPAFLKKILMIVLGQPQ